MDMTIVDVDDEWDAWRGGVRWRVIRDSGGAVLLHHLAPLFILLSLPRHRIGRKGYIP
jgi:hypothetical protein